MIYTIIVALYALNCRMETCSIVCCSVKGSTLRIISFKPLREGYQKITSRRTCKEWYKPLAGFSVIKQRLPDLVRNRLSLGASCCIVLFKEATHTASLYPRTRVPRICQMNGKQPWNLVEGMDAFGKTSILIIWYGCPSKHTKKEKKKNQILI